MIPKAPEGENPIPQKTHTSETMGFFMEDLHIFGTI
jgi:hypothetical protein